MQAFPGAIFDCNLEDMRIVGGLFTWCNSHTKECLDKGLASPVGMMLSLFLVSFIWHQVSSIIFPYCWKSELNHRPWIDAMSISFWRNLVISSILSLGCWSRSQPQLGSPMLQLCCRIKDTCSQLLEWDKAVFSRRKVELEETRLLLQ